MRTTHKGALHRSLRCLRQMSGGNDDGVVMYLKKVDGPRAVTLPDGTVMTHADLPCADTRRWVASRKAAVVRGVVYGLLSKDEALKRYNLSDDEFIEWVRAVSTHGEAALKATMLQKYRQL